MAATTTTLEPRGREIARLRLEAGMRQVDLARKLRRSTSYVQKLETGLRGASPITAKRLARLFKCDVPDLFDVVDEKVAS